MRSTPLFMVKEDSLHHMDLFDMGFMVIWHYRNSSYSPKKLLQMAHDKYRKNHGARNPKIPRYLLPSAPSRSRKYTMDFRQFKKNRKYNTRDSRQTPVQLSLPSHLVLFSRKLLSKPFKNRRQESYIISYYDLTTE